MSLPRFYVSEIPEAGSIRLDEAESNHAARVLRAAIGEDVLVFDGRGNEGFGTIESITKKTVSIDVQGRRFAPRDHDDRLWFAIALPKGDRQRSVVERSVELGVDRLIPLHSSRSVAKCDEDAVARLDRYGIEACKQCHRNRKMQIDAAIEFETLMQRLQSQPQIQSWVLHPDPDGVAIDSFVSTVLARVRHQQQTITKLLFLVGPEGGFTSEEIQMARAAHCSLLNLGERILRVETAVSTAAVLGEIAIQQLRCHFPSQWVEARED
ncbi:MAG: RsmE family RNA methyltransferase [Planctomycetota bacterium]